MQKETMRNIREIATVTAVGAAEGAAIGFATGMGFLSLQGYAAGGIIGGLTALTAELAGRIYTQDITISYSIAKQPFGTEKESTIQKKSITHKNVPDIKRGDAIFSILPHAMKDIFVPLRDIKSTSLNVKETHISKSGATETRTRGMELTYPDPKPKT